MEPWKVREREDTALKDALGKILHSGAYSDMKIRLSDATEITCHRAILCERCDFFKNALQSGFKEAHSGIIEMFDDPPEAVRAMISYLYTADYPDNGLIGPDLGLFHVDVYIIAATYLIEGLAHVARAHVWDSLSDLSVLFPDVANALRECNLRFGKLYETEEFYNEVIEYAIEIHLDLMFHFGEIHFDAMKMECPEFAQDVTEKAWKLWKIRNHDSSAWWLDLYGDLGEPIMVRSVKCPRKCGYVSEYFALRSKETAPLLCGGCDYWFRSAEWFAKGEVIIDSEEDTESDSDSEEDIDGNKGSEDDTERNNGSEEDTESNNDSEEDAKGNNGFAEDAEGNNGFEEDSEIDSDSEEDRESDSGSEEGFESSSDGDDDGESD